MEGRKFTSSGNRIRKREFRAFGNDAAVPANRPALATIGANQHTQKPTSAQKRRQRKIAKRAQYTIILRGSATQHLLTLYRWELEHLAPNQPSADSVTAENTQENDTYDSWEGIISESSEEEEEDDEGCLNVWEEEDTMTTNLSETISKETGKETEETLHVSDTPDKGVSDTPLPVEVDDSVDTEEERLLTRWNNSTLDLYDLSQKELFKVRDLLVGGRKLPQHILTEVTTVRVY